LPKLLGTGKFKKLTFPRSIRKNPLIFGKKIEYIKKFHIAIHYSKCKNKLMAIGHMTKTSLRPVYENT
jgi:hypothetical protein